jgi:exodeoxyribonuclease VII large subunit
VSEAKAQSAARAHRLQRAYQLRISSASARLATIEQQLPRAAALSLRNRTQTLRTARLRLSPQRVQAQLERQRQQLTDHARTLRTQALAKLAGLRAGLDQQRPRLQRVLGARVQPSAARVGLLDMRLRTAGRARLLREQEALARATGQLSEQRVQARCDRERQTLEARDRILRAHDPRRALERGFSLTYGPSGRLVRSVRDVEVGQAITTHLADGELQSQVQRAQVQRSTEESHE